MSAVAFWRGTGFGVLFADAAGVVANDDPEDDDDGVEVEFVDGAVVVVADVSVVVVLETERPDTMRYATTSTTITPAIHQTAVRSPLSSFPSAMAGWVVGTLGRETAFGLLSTEPKQKNVSRHVLFITWKDDDGGG